MSDTVKLNNCPKCGGPIPAEAPQGLCPKCLLLQATLPTEGGKPGRTTAAPPSQDELAAAFPQLEILELIGQGGMGFVFKARQSKLDRLVALKILPQTLAADPAFAERFTREGRVLAKLNHPNIVTIHDFGQAGGFFYLLMEFVNGVNLRQAMQAGRFTPAQALGIVPKICEALEFAHEEGILHRDIKPENILLDSKGRVKIADFGIAKLIGEVEGSALLTASGAMLGTPHYMAPEQLEKPGQVDHRADIFSLGVVFYEMLTGELPLGRFQPPSQKVQMDVRLDDVVLQALEKEPSRRYQQVSQVKTAVETVTSTTPPPPSASPTTGAPHRPPAGTSNRWWKWAAVAVGVIALGLVLVPIVAILMGIALPAWERKRTEASASTIPNVNIVGTITDHESRKPVAGARIVLTGISIPPREILAGSQGEFKLANLRTEELHLAISAEGYDPSSVSMKTSEFANDNRRRLELRLLPIPRKTIVLTRPTIRLVDETNTIRNITLWTDARLIPGEEILAHIKLPDGDLVDSRSTLFTSCTDTNVRTSCGMSWAFPDPFTNEDAEAVLFSLRRNTLDRPLLLMAGKRIELFSSTNALGGVTTGYIEFVRRKPEAPSVEVPIHATVKLGYAASYLPSINYSATVPAGYVLRATANAGQASTHVTFGTTEYHSSWFRSTIYTPGAPISNRQAEQAATDLQLQALQQAGRFTVFPGEPFLLFSVTNAQNEVYKTFLELVGPPVKETAPPTGNGSYP